MSSNQTPAAAPHLMLGLLRIGPAHLALPVAQMREVLPCPAQLPCLPSRVNGLCGAVDVRGLMMPVLDLAPLLGLPSPAPEQRIIIVVRCHGRLLGLLADQVEGMVALRPDDQQPLLAQANGGQPALLSHIFQREGQAVAVLDASQIAILPDVPWVDEDLRAQAQHAQTHHPESVLLFQCASRRLGVCALEVQGTVPNRVIQASPLQGGLCRGVVEHHGREVPVVDTLELLSLGRMDDRRHSAMLLVRFPAHGVLALMIDAVSDIAQVDTAEGLRVPRLAVPRAELFRFALDGRNPATGQPAPGQQSLVIDMAALHSQPLLRNLASLTHASPGPAARPQGLGQPRATQTGQAYLSFSAAGQDFACPLDQICEILPFPVGQLARTSTANHVLGMMTHRQEAMAVICLAAVMACSPPRDPGRARLLVVRGELEPVAFAVEGLRAIAPGRSFQPDRRAASEHPVPAIAWALSMVDMDIEGRQQTLPTLALKDLADRMLGGQVLPDEAQASTPA